MFKEYLQRLIDFDYVTLQFVHITRKFSREAYWSLPKWHLQIIVLSIQGYKRYSMSNQIHMKVLILIEKSNPFISKIWLQNTSTIYVIKAIFASHAYLEIGRKFCCNFCIFLRRYVLVSFSDIVEYVSIVCIIITKAF